MFSCSTASHFAGPASNVSKLLDSNAAEPQKPLLFCEMLHLSSAGFLDSDLQPHWLQTGRWIKYEQTAEGEGSRFSKPHLTFMRLPSVLQLKSTLKRGVVLLDAPVDSFLDLVDLLLAAWLERGQLEEGSAKERLVRLVLQAPKLHSGASKRRRVEELLGAEARIRSSTNSSASQTLRNTPRKLSESPLSTDRLSARGSCQEEQSTAPPQSPKPDDVSGLAAEIQIVNPGIALNRQLGI